MLGRPKVGTIHDHHVSDDITAVVIVVLAAASGAPLPSRGVVSTLLISKAEVKSDDFRLLFIQSYLHLLKLLLQQLCFLVKVTALSYVYVLAMRILIRQVALVVD